MNLLELSQRSNDDEECEQMSMLHTGLSDVNLTMLGTGWLPPKNSAAIDKLMTDLIEKSDRRNTILAKLIDAVISSFDPITRADYLWYLQFTVSVLLLKDLPVSFYAGQGHLLTVCFSPPTTVWVSDPVKLDYFASNLYDCIKDDANLIFITNQIETRSTFAFYLSISMLWKSIYRCIGEEKSIFRLYPPSNLIDVTKRISLKKLDTEYQTVLTFIILHSKISSLLFHRKRNANYKCYEEFFAYDLSLIKTLKGFLEDTMIQAETMWRREPDNLNYLTLVEYLQIDISELDTLIGNSRTL